MKPKLKKTSHLIRLGSVSKETQGTGIGKAESDFYVKWP